MVLNQKELGMTRKSLEGAEYSFKGDKLTIDKSGMKMEFKKSTQADIDEILSRASKGK